MSALKTTRLLLLAVLGSVMLPAWDISFAVTVGGSSDRWNLPSEDLTYVHGGTRGNVRYEVQDFIAPFSGLFQFLSVAAGGWDNYLVLYRGSFNSSTPLANAIAANDNYPVVGRAGFTASLTAGERYYVVTSAANNGANGNTAWQATTTSAAVPEPGTMVLVGGGILYLAVRRRSSKGPNAWKIFR